MKKISRKLLMSLISMAFAIVALGTTTFAWFTMNSTATAKIEVGVQGGGDGIVISKDGTSFKSDIDFGVSDITLQPVTYDYSSSVGSATTIASFDKFDEKSGLVDATNGMILQFSIYVSCNAANTKVYFNTTGNSISSSSVTQYTLLNGFTFKNSNGTESKFLDGTTIYASAVNALRAVVDVHEDDENRETVTKEAKKDGGLGSDYFGAGKRIAPVFGFTESEIMGKSAIIEPDTDSTDGNAYNFGQSLSLDNAANSYLTAINSETFKDITAPEGVDLVNGFNNFADPIYISRDKPNYVNKLTFTFWLEGFDADCFDVIMGQSLSINLSFTTAR